MISTGYDLPFALRVCDKLQTGWDQTSCTGGVYMENVNAANGTSIGFKTTVGASRTTSSTPATRR